MGRLGASGLGDWSWDVEDRCWEVAVLGLPRVTELDLEPDGTFSELERVDDISEIESVQPNLAKTVHEMSRGQTDLFIELGWKVDDVSDREQSQLHPR